MNEGEASAGLTPDQCAAHEFLSELRTRISTQPLPYQYGVEARALESLWAVFEHARTAMTKYPGCGRFADAVTQMLNVELRPLTAKWDRAHEEGRLNARDGADEFRQDLAKAQEKLRQFAGKLHQMAYATPFEDVFAPGVISEDQLSDDFKSLSFGILPSTLIPAHVVEPINKSEAEAVQRRRANHRVCAPKNMNAVGLALSGGGIRSATFCLGVVQVLASRNLLKDIDFLSTVSGGGYTGAFLTTRLGNREPQASIGQPYGPDPAPIRYLRQHAKFLAAVDLKQGWSMVTATLAGMLLNWTAPLLLVALAALGAIVYRCTVAPAPWASILTYAGVLTVATLV